MSVNRTRHRPARPGVAAAGRHDTSRPDRANDDQTPSRLVELAVLWPKLGDAIDRDTAGPSAEARSGPSGAKAGSPAVIDLDTERVRTAIERGVSLLAAEARPLLNIEAPARRMALLYAALEVRQHRRRDARATVARIRATCERERRGPDADEQSAARAAIAATGVANREIAELRRRMADVVHANTTGRLLTQLPAWYAGLRAAGQPLAEHIAEDVKRWHDDARSALNLRTRESRLGWRCPKHRDEPAELIQHRDEAKLSPAVLAGATPRKAAPLTWDLSESVYCPHCHATWAGVVELNHLMKMIDRAEEDEQMQSEVIEVVRRMAAAEQEAGNPPLMQFEADLLGAVGVEIERCPQGCECRRATNDSQVDLCECLGECNDTDEDGNELLYEDAQKWLDFELALPDRFRASGPSS